MNRNVDKATKLTKAQRRKFSSKLQGNLLPLVCLISFRCVFVLFLCRSKTTNINKIDFLGLFHYIISEGYIRANVKQIIASIGLILWRFHENYVKQFRASLVVQELHQYFRSIPYQYFRSIPYRSLLIL